MVIAHRFVWFYVIVANPVYTKKLNIQDFAYNILNELEIIFLQLNDFKYFYFI